MKKVLSFWKNIKPKNKGTIIIIVSGSLVILSLLFLPLNIFYFIVGILLFFVGVDLFRKRKEKQKNRTQQFYLPFIFLISVINIGYAVYPFLHYTFNSSYDGTTFTYDQRDTIFNGEAFQYQHDFTNKYGNVDPPNTLSVPSGSSWVFHKHTSRQESSTIDIQFHTNIELKGDEVRLIIKASNDNDIESATTLKDIWLPLGNDTERYFYDYMLNETYTYDVGKNTFTYYFFKVKGNISTDQGGENNFYSQIQVTPSQSGGEFGHTDIALPSAIDILNDQLSRDIFFMLLILITFLMFFLILWVTGKSKLARYPLVILTMVGVIILFIEIALADQKPLIRNVLEALEGLEWLDMGDFRPIYWLKTFVLLVAIVLAILFWVLTIGTSLSICFALFYFWNKIFGSFLGNILQENI